MALKQKFLPNQIIRNKKTGEPMLVIHVYRNAIVVTDPQSKGYLADVKFILERDYNDWARDLEMIKKGETEWEYIPLY